MNIIIFVWEIIITHNFFIQLEVFIRANRSSYAIMLISSNLDEDIKMNKKKCVILSHAKN